MRRSAFTLVAVAATLMPLTQAAGQIPGGPVPAPINWPQNFQGDVRGGPGILARVGWGIGGAILGAGLGFFASQLAEGDWQESGRIDRGLWSVVGGSVGLALGAGFPLTGGRKGTGQAGLPSGRDHLGADEIEGLGFDNVYDAVATLRPEWMKIRGDRSLAPGIDPVNVGGAPGALTITGSTPLVSEIGTIQVYANYVPMGGLLQLKNVDVRSVRDIYFFDTAAATGRFGGSNPHGAILIMR